MHEPHDESDEKMEVLGEFLEELPRAADAEALVRRYAMRHPQWTKDFLEEAVVSRLLTTSRADAAFPDLTELTDFKIVRGIAAGGMGVVYEAEQLSLHRRVALKVRYGHASPEREAAFEREQRVLARLHQSHIVPIYQSGRCGVWQYFAMAYIEGTTLHQLLRTVWVLAANGRPVPALRDLVAQAVERERHLDGPTRLAEFAADLTYHSVQFVPNAAERVAAAPPAKALRLPAAYYRSVAVLVADAADAVAHAHAANVIHRDIKPSNVMVDHAGQCWLIDFGLADVANPDGDALPTTAAGTPGYIAPEQLRPDAAPASVRSDVWALGVTLFEAVTLRRPLSGAEAQPIRSLVSNVPADLAAICNKALEPDPADRYESAHELANDLRRWLEDRPTLARPVKPWRAAALWARRNKGWAAAIACVCALLVASAAFVTVRAGHQAEQADLRSRAAEAQAHDEREKARLLERETWLQDVQRLQQLGVSDGWSDGAWALLERANEVRSDSRVRDLAIGTMRGWDVRRVKYFRFGSSSVAFAPDGRTLAFGGFTTDLGKPVRPAGTWAVGSEAVADAPRTGEGPVAWDAQGAAVHLVHRNDELVLGALRDDRVLWRVPFPGGKAVTDTLTLGLSPDAAWLAASAEVEPGKPRTRVWKAASESPWLEFDFAADAIAFAGEFVALADNAHHRIAIHSLPSKALVAELPTGTVPTLSLAFGKNPKPAAAPLAKLLLAAGDAGGTAAVWDLRTKVPVSHCRGLTHHVLALAFHPDGTLLATSGREDVRLWEAASGKPVLRFRPKEGLDYVSQLAFSPDGARLAVASRGSYATPCTTLWELTNGRGLTRLTGLSGQVETVVVSPDGRSVAALAQNYELGVWDAETGSLKFLLDVPAGAFADNAGLAFGPDGKTLAYGVGTAEKGTALLLDATTGAELRRWPLPPGLQNRFGFDGPNLWHFQTEIESGRALPTSNFSPEEHPRVGRLRNLLAAEPGRVLAEVRDLWRGVYCARTTPDGRYTVMDGVGDGRGVRVLDHHAGKVVATWPTAYADKNSGLFVDPGGGRAVLQTTPTQSMTCCAVPDGRVLQHFATPRTALNGRSGYSVRGLSIAPFGCLLFQRDDETPVADLALGVPVNATAFDPAGRFLVWGGRDGSVVVCRLDAVRDRLSPLGLGW